MGALSLYNDGWIFVVGVAFLEGVADFVAVGILHYIIAVFNVLEGVAIVGQCGGYLGAVGLLYEGDGEVYGIGGDFLYGSYGEEGQEEEG